MMASGVPSHTTGRPRAPWVERLVVGALLATALFSVEAGLGQIALSRDAACREAATSMRLGPPEAGNGCLPELGLAATRSLAFGPGGALLTDAPLILAWGLSLGVYAILGGVCAQLTLGWAAGTFFSFHIVLLGAVAFFSYITPYVSF
jgi:hypothetical protein